ncbi:molybdenum cofactor synthesis domain-containing protein [Paucidesulfovibrio gracilis DSM 16080]|uniref:Molybdopterin adenylyltransferase n=1 Tax=Paucidesulfovibrio gracilis DSM 16080 TaxID=1121449 RepID=A0A1T4WRZ2_9BACT|nr:MogA/MoaB family molybdenum cofactor biosynthesis protein [Paucidesulfovibrio gracilis]SKA79877.1 molybdenum cofactor synthesis domain-containing protein [Paucidesulfovibrio gracilis DSM 16080]
MPTTKHQVQLEHAVSKGERVEIDWTHKESLRAGTLLCDDHGPVLRAVGFHLEPGEPERPGRALRLFAAQRDLTPGLWEGLHVERRGWSVAWVTLSDKGARGERIDTAGPLVGEMLGEHLDVSLTMGYLLPDDQSSLQLLLMDLAWGQGVDLIVTTGGTGVAPRDVAPDATLRVIEKRLPGMERAMTSESLAKTPHAMISRAVAGTLGLSLIINLPGSPKAVRECLGVVLPALRHTLEKLHGDPSDCGGA